MQACRADDRLHIKGETILEDKEYLEEAKERKEEDRAVSEEAENSVN